MKKKLLVIFSILVMFIVFACGNTASIESNFETSIEAFESEEETKNTIKETEEIREVIDWSTLESERRYYESQPLDVSADGETCYVLDYYGGQLDKKYLKFKKLDFSKNNGKHIKSVRGMFSLLDKDYGGKYSFYSSYSINNRDYEKHFSEDIADLGWVYNYEDGSTYEVRTFNVLEEVNLSGLDLSECEDMSEMFAYCKNLKKVNFANVDTKKVKSMYKMFHRCTNLETIENFNIDTSNVKEMDGMFFFCSNLKNVDFSSFKADKLLYMNYMFYKCESLESINLNNFNPKSCILFNNAFMLNKSLKTIDLSNFDTSEGSNFSFMYYGDENLESIDLSKFNISNAENLGSMFYGCKKIESLVFNESRININDICDMRSMFEKMENIKTIDMGKVSATGHLYLIDMFKDCFKLEEVNISNFDLLSKNNTGTGMFDGCSEIKKVDISSNISVENNLDNEIVKQINFVRNYDKNHSHCESRNKIYNRDLVETNFEGWQKLINNEFAVVEFDENLYGDDIRFKEFFEIYEQNKYKEFPSFVTTDSMLHTYHLYFDFLMKKIEKENLSNKLINLSNKMYQVCKNYCNALKGTEWEQEAIKLKVYFAVPLIIFDEKFVVDDDIKGIVAKEISMIEEHSKARSYKPIFEDWAAEYELIYLDTSVFLDDYTQYKPRGHYDGDDQLEKYFKVFMWFGRTDFNLIDEHLTKMAILMSYALNESEEINEYNNIKKVIYYFAGESDDRGPVEYIDIIERTYGTKVFNIANVININYFEKFKKQAEKFPSSRINSGPGVVSVKELEGKNAISFRFIGQSYTYDADIFKNLIYDYVKEFNLKKRFLPDFLDVPASLKSKTAEEILKDEGNFNFPEYESNLKKMQNEMPTIIEKDSTDVLYTKWVRTLKKFIDSEDNNSFPSFMKNNEWKKKKLETFGGSYAELKHDTILYTKQTYSAEGGEGGMDEFYDEEYVKYDDKGYVEPEVQVYMELYKLANDTLYSFSEMGMIDQEGKDFLMNFANLSLRLCNISEKELGGEKLSDDDYDFIRGYGGTIEHLITDSGVYEYTYDDQKKSNAIVADIATGDGNALEIATGNPIKVYVLVEVDGKYKICSGGVFDFYQFTIPARDRMTDKEWRVMMGFEYADSYDMSDRESSLKTIKENLKFQDWTKSYRHKLITNSSGNHALYKFGEY